MADIPQASLFMTWEWLSAWWRYFGEGRDLWLLAAWDEDGKLAGLAPWMLVQEQRGPLIVNRVTFMFYRLRPAVHLDVLARATEREAICGAVFSHLTSRGGEWDVLDLKGLVRDSTLASLIAKAPAHHLERESLACPIIPLPDDWNSYYKGLSKKLRKNLRYYRNRLERESPGKVVFRQVKETDQLSRAMDTLFALNRKRRHTAKMWSTFDNERFVRFNHEIARLGMERGWLRLFELVVADQTIASLCCYRYREVFYAYQMGFDPEWRSCSPALLLIAHAIRQAVGEGAHMVDLLPGTDHHKVIWTNHLHADAHLMMSNGWQGHVWLFGAASFDRIKSWARKCVPESTRHRINLHISSRQR